MATREYTHTELGREVESISGQYVADREILLYVGDREVLCVLGTAIWDKACCGPGGCQYALVPGYVVKYKARTNTEGEPISLVETIDSKEEQKGIKQDIEALEYVQQVNFW